MNWTKVPWRGSCPPWRRLRDEGNIKGEHTGGLLSCLPFSQQLVRGYMEIFGKDCYLVVRNETAALFDAQDGQVAALHAQELEPACKGGLGEPLTGAELLYLWAYDVFGMLTS